MIVQCVSWWQGEGIPLAEDRLQSMIVREGDSVIENRDLLEQSRFARLGNSQTGRSRWRENAAAAKRLG